MTDKSIKNIYTREEALKILEEYGTPKHVIGHCKAVADVAVRVAERLNTLGFDLDVGLCEAAGLLHDMARLEPDHQLVAAKWLRDHGHDAEADIIEVHMQYPQFSEASETNETDLVCLGDRVCIEDKYVGPEKRFAYIFDKNKHLPHRTEIIAGKREQMMRYISDLEEILGISLDELMS